MRILSKFIKIKNWPKWVINGIIISSTWIFLASMLSIFIYHLANLNILFYTILVLLPLIIGWLYTCLHRRIILVNELNDIKTLIINMAHNDIKVRKKWFISFLTFHALFYLVGALDEIFGQAIDGFPRISFYLSNNGNVLNNFYNSTIFNSLFTDHNNPIIASLLYTQLICRPLLHSFIAGLTYYYAYHKKSTTLLKLIIFSLSTLICFELNQIYKYAIHDWSYAGCPTGKVFSCIIIFYLSLYYLINCWRLLFNNAKKRKLDLTNNTTFWS